jgi:hypothetical protein
MYRYLVILGVWMSLSTYSLYAQTVESLVQIGRAIGANLDDTNGLPVLVRDRFGRSRAAEMPQDRRDAAALASGLAQVQGIPVVAQGAPTRCPWYPSAGEAPVGLAAEFQKPEFDGTTVRLYLTTSCLQSPRPGQDRQYGFQQGHLFVLQLGATGEWEVIERRLVSIT